MKYLLIACMCGVALTAANPVRAQGHPVRILYDTDLGPDSDDAGALALLHALVNRGEAVILGVTCSTTSPWCAPAADAIDTYYRRPDVPVGTLKGAGPAGGSEEWYGDSFNGYVAGHFSNDLHHGSNATDALVLYRRILAEQPDTSVVIVATGPLTNLRNLLASQPDSISRLDGIDLVRRKVKALSVMGGKYPEGGESNFMVDAAATKLVVETWPTPITFSGFEIGVDLLTGPRLRTETPPNNPVTTAYHLWDLYFARRFQPDFDPDTGIWPHSSYDQTAMLYAVRGLRDYWTAQTTGRNVIHEDGSNAWQSSPDSEQAYLIERMPREQLAKIIEDLMVAPPEQ
ncbi:MAG TPA: nucleoside hydrolase [Rhodothermales bacterium]|nr:nucleoside hydrolase [Rhodothermales bacterium]